MHSQVLIDCNRRTNYGNMDMKASRKQPSQDVSLPSFGGIRMTRRDAIIFLAGSGVTALMIYLFANIPNPSSHPSQSTTSTTTVRGGGGVGSMPTMNIIGTGTLDTRELT